jgi:putative FmdB family regulatory protein
MPTYEYQCKSCSHRFDLFQSITAPVKRKCPKCGRSALERLIGVGAGIIFKGGGFYETDYRSETYKKAAEAETKAAEGKTEAKTESKPDTTPESTPKSGRSADGKSGHGSASRGDSKPQSKADSTPGGGDSTHPGGRAAKGSKADSTSAARTGGRRRSPAPSARRGCGS